MKKKKKKEISFVLLTKLCIVCAVSIKSARWHVPGNEVESLQNELHFIQFSFLLWFFKGWILVGKAISKEAPLGSILQKQKCHQAKAKLQINDGCKAAPWSGSKKD